MVPIEFGIVDIHGKPFHYSCEAILDSGSPISLVKASALRSDAYLPMINGNHRYYGVNESPSIIEDILSSEVKKLLYL